MFEGLMERIYEEICYRIFRATTSLEALEKFLGSLTTKTVHQDVSAMGQAAADAQDLVNRSRQQQNAEAANEQAMQAALEKHEPIKRDEPKVGRNDPCPCGSGKKYKKCCGAE